MQGTLLCLSWWVSSATLPSSSAFFPPLPHFSSQTLCFIQVRCGTEGLTQPAARQRPYSAVSINQLSYLLRVLWDHHNAMSHSQKSIHMLRKMLFSERRHCFTDVAQTRVIYTKHTCMSAKTHARTHTITCTHRLTCTEGKRGCFVSMWDLSC